MGVQDNLPSCPHIPDKDFGSCQPIHDAAPVSSVPQFTLSHRRLVPCILAARSGVSALDSSGAAHRGGDLGPAGEPRRTASPLCPWGLAGPAEPVQECRAGRVWHLGTGGPCGGGSRGGSSPRQWDGVSGAGQRVQPHRDDTMELPRVLLALAGTGAAAGLGDSPGGTGGLGGAVRCFPRGSFKCVCAREGVMRPGMAGRSPHQCCPPGAGTAGTP